MSAAILAPQAILHECAGIDHMAEITPTQTVKLGCGCTRGRGTRCDGTPIEWLTVVRCGYHRDDEETAAGPMRGPADATHLQREPLPRGSQRPARPGEAGGLDVTPPAGWHWRYLPRKLTLHALNDPDAKMARCGVSERGRQWRGDANQYERDRAAMLAFCANCQRSVGASLADLRGEPAPKTKGTAVTEPERVETVILGNETDTGETQSDDEQAGAEAAEDSTAE